jgi:hypothetical protein
MAPMKEEVKAARAAAAAKKREEQEERREKRGEKREAAQKAKEERKAVRAAAAAKKREEKEARKRAREEAKEAKEAMAASPLEKLSNQILGQIGEDIPQSEFTDIKNLNSIKHNFPVFDLIAKKDDEVYVFSVKARKRYGASGKLNSCYNILYGSKTMARKYKKALDAFTEIGHDINTIHYCFLVCPLEENKPCMYYWGEFTDINPLCIATNILENKIPFFGIPVSNESLTKYKLFGRCEWEYIQEKYM